MKGLIVCLSLLLYKRRLRSQINEVKALHGLEQVKVLLEGAVSVRAFVDKGISVLAPGV